MNYINLININLIIKTCKKTLIIIIIWIIKIIIF